MKDRGFEISEEGEWQDIVDFCREVSLALVDGPFEDRDRFEEWRPKKEEGRREMRDRTVDGESIGKTRMEEESEGARKELSRAGGEMRDSGSELVHGNARESVKKAGEAGNSTAKGIIPALARLIRGLERGVYRNVIEPTNPDYFESDSFSASVEKRVVNGGHYRCRIVFEEKEMKENVLERME